MIGLLLGPLLFTLVLFLPLPDGMMPQGLRVAAVAVLMAVWWVTEAIPIPAIIADRIGEPTLIA